MRGYWENKGIIMEKWENLGQTKEKWDWKIWENQEKWENGKLFCC